MAFRDFFQRLSDRMKYPNEDFVRKAFKVVVYSNIIGIVAYVKYSDTNTKLKFSFTRAASRAYGKMFRWNVPKTWRPFVYGTFSSIFKVNLEEMKKPLEEFECMNDFFIREIKSDARKINECPLVSPCDGKVMSFGVANTNLESIKGRDYSLSKLLTGEEAGRFDNYSESLKENKENSLFYVTIYLAPGDYHRFHSPAEWTINYRRHLYGYMLGVFPWNLWRRGDVFVVNERVAYFGKWKFGAMHYVAVAAYNVGDIKIHCDPDLATNKTQFTCSEDTFDQKELKVVAGKGEEFGMFNAGSTIVLVFEAPKTIEWQIKVGDRVQLGDKLTSLT